MKFCPRCSEFFPNEAELCPDDGTELKRTYDPYLGRTIAARYRLTRRLGSGGMSSVYLAHHIMIERLSAIKIMRDDLSLNPTHRERFLREARAVNRINHPNIVEISDLGEADGVAYLVMEYINGPSLHQALMDGPLPWQRAVRIAIQVAGALARAHQMGVIHRDLKPENILLAPQVKDLAGGAPYPMPLYSEDDLVKLTDFGIAKIVDAPALTFAEQLFGTPGYIAPEYIEGAPAEPRSDLYSLGVILYEMTTGKLPYDARGATLLTMPLREPPIPPSARIHDYLPELEELILRLLSRRPNGRPPDAFFVYDALVQLLRGHGFASMTPTPDDTVAVVSLTPDATRISYAAQVNVRQDALTMMEQVHPVEASALYSRQTTDLTEAEAAGTVRWHESIAELDTEIAAARRARLAPERADLAAELVNVARSKLRALERASRTVRAEQTKVDALEADARKFRADIGHAIDQLVRDRSRERANADAVQKRRLEMDPVSSRETGPASDVRVWETAALSVEEERVGAADVDLTFQIDSLQNSLDTRNAELDEKLVAASGSLEGALSALRHLTHEVGRALDEATGQLRDHRDPELETQVRE